jgi:hypothetical protein
MLKDTVTVLYVNRWEFEGRRGCSVSYIASPVDRDNAKGTPVVKITGADHLWGKIGNVPGKYEMTFNQVSRDGRPGLGLEDLQEVARSRSGAPDPVPA